eukprot:558342_1
MEDWLDIINDDNNADQDGDRIVLPQPQIIDLPTTQNIQKEISYRFDENNPENIIRTERIFQIVNTQKRVSNASIQRKKHWVKFGECKSVAKGTFERGVTNQREGNFPFLWNGKNMQPKAKPEPKPKPRRRTAAEVKAQEMKPIIPPKPTGKYIPAHLRLGASTGVFDEDDKVEIKISNLPQWSEFMNVKRLIDEFYKIHLNQRYIPKYRIRMIPSKRTLEQWNAEPQFYANRLAEYERLAIVEFENETSAQKAIKLLDGHHYDSHILRVEKAKPRNR